MLGKIEEIDIYLVRAEDDEEIYSALVCTLKTGEEEPKRFRDVMPLENNIEKVNALMASAQRQKLSELVDVPIEVKEDESGSSWRILTEVI